MSGPHLIVELHEDRNNLAKHFGCITCDLKVLLTYRDLLNEDFGALEAAQRQPCERNPGFSFKAHNVCLDEKRSIETLTYHFACLSCWEMLHCYYATPIGEEKHHLCSRICAKFLPAALAHRAECSKRLAIQAIGELLEEDQQQGEQSPPLPPNLFKHLFKQETWRDRPPLL